MNPPGAEIPSWIVAIMWGLWLVSGIYLILFAAGKE